jgi:hypothetical protein
VIAREERYLERTADLAALIEETEAEIANAEKQRTIEATLALDPKEARQVAAHATFVANRLRALLPRLQAHYEQACEQARVDEYEAAAQVLDEESIRLADALREIYPAAVDKLSSLFARIVAHRGRISALHQRRPPGVESVRDPELIARNLDRFDRELPSLLTVVHLCDWTNGGEKWPPPQPSIAGAFAATAMPTYDRRFTADWAKENERRAATQRAEQQRMADYYARLTQEQEERENAEARQRFAESQRKNSA